MVPLVALNAPIRGATQGKQMQTFTTPWYLLQSLQE